MKKSKSYTELMTLPDYVDRYEYLKLGGSVGELTFNGHRYYNQKFYSSDPQWLETKKRVILRDEGCDMGHDDYPIHGRILIHHINPITIEELMNLISTIWYVFHTRHIMPYTMGIRPYCVCLLLKGWRLILVLGGDIYVR